MPSAELLDFETLLAPISDENPVGVDLRTDSSPGSAYHAVRDARSANRAAERQLLADVGDGDAPDWRPVLQRGVQVLAEQSKDLEITAFVIEALVRLHGFAGLRDGFRLARELIERHWDGLFPLPDEDGIETRLAPLIGLNGAEGEGTLISPILCVPLTRSDSTPLACYHFQQALALAQIKDENVREKRLQDGTISLETIQQAVAETPRDFFAVLVQDLTQCQAEFARLTAVLDEKCGAHSPPTSNIRNALNACYEALQQVAKSKLPSAENNGTVAGAASANGTTAVVERGLSPKGGMEAVVSAQGVLTRADAFRVLTEVADYFRRTEPHSVVSYSLEQVVRWGNMPLPALLSELITDDSPRRQLFRQVGIRMAKTTEDED